MKFGICNEIFKEWNDIERTIDYVKGIGYDGLEVAPFTLSQYVTDIGDDVRQTIVKKAGEVSADVVGLSALMTTTMVEMPGIIASLKTACPSVKIIIGGAVVTQRYADQIGAHGYAKDAVEAVAVVNTLLGSNGNGA